MLKFRIGFSVACDKYNSPIEKPLESLQKSQMETLDKWHFPAQLTSVPELRFGTSGEAIHRALDIDHVFVSSFGFLIPDEAMIVNKDSYRLSYRHFSRMTPCDYPPKPGSSQILRKKFESVVEPPVMFRIYAIMMATWLLDS